MAIPSSQCRPSVWVIIRRFLQRAITAMKRLPPTCRASRWLPAARRVVSGSSGLVPNQRAVIQCVGLDERGNPSLPTAALEFSTLDTIPPQPLESARVSFRDHIADAATEVARLEWLVSADKPVYALEISDQNNLLEGLTVQLETEADTLWTRATQDNDTVEAFMLGDSIAEGTLTLRAYDAEGNLVELDASITALLYTRRSVAEWFTPEVYVQGSWDDRPEEPTAAVTMEFAIVSPRPSLPRL